MISSIRANRITSDYYSINQAKYNKANNSQVSFGSATLKLSCFEGITKSARTTLEQAADEID